MASLGQVAIGLAAALAALWLWAVWRRRAAPASKEVDDPALPASRDAPIREVPIEDSIDLHTFAPRDVASVVEEYVREARRRGFTEVRVIHGKGKGVQRRVVEGVLARHRDVASWRGAPATRGGWGATLVVLKPRRR